MSGWRRLLSTTARYGALTALVTLSACASFDEAASPGGPVLVTDEGPPTPNPGLDVGIDVPFDSATSSTDAGPDLPNPLRAEFPPGSVKDEPGFVVPATVAPKGQLVVSATQAAWIQTDIKGKPRLVTWDLFGGATPQVRGVNVVRPRDLAISDDYVVWVDDTFDTAGDIFALDLQTDSAFLVVGAPNVQRRPAIRGSVVVWEDCRNCPADVSKPAPDLYRRDLAAPPGELQLTADSAMDRFPTVGTLSNGAVAVAWLRGSDTVRVLGGGLDESFPAGLGVEGVALAQGKVAFRAQPAIINPDSMIPTDPWAIDVASGAQVTLASDQNIVGSMPSGVTALGDGRFAWLALNPADQGDASVVIAEPDGSGTVTVLAPGATQMAAGGAWIGFVAPRADNDGAPDVWLAPAP